MCSCRKCFQMRAMHFLWKLKKLIMSLICMIWQVSGQTASSSSGDRLEISVPESDVKRLRVWCAKFPLDDNDAYYVSASSVHWSHPDSTSNLAFHIVVNVNCSHMRNNSNVFFNTLFLAYFSLLAKICWDSGNYEWYLLNKNRDPCHFWVLTNFS